MFSILTELFLRKRKSSNQKKLNAATAKKVLQFVCYGLTYGAQRLANHYKPRSKVSEFVAVSGAILGGLKPQPGKPRATDSMAISVHVNDSQKEIRFMQVGDHVMLVLDGCEAFISFTTLDQIYTSLRNDMLNHADIYGKGLQATALSYPA